MEQTTEIDILREELRNAKVALLSAKGDGYAEGVADCVYTAEQLAVNAAKTTGNPLFLIAAGGVKAFAAVLRDKGPDHKAMAR